jgi:hypothetical protein
MPTRPMASTCKLISRRCDDLFSRLPGRRLSGNNRAGVELRPSSRPIRPVVSAAASSSIRSTSM